MRYSSLLWLWDRNINIQSKLLSHVFSQQPWVLAQLVVVYQCPLDAVALQHVHELVQQGGDQQPYGHLEQIFLG